jgi:hypothetical protein
MKAAVRVVTYSEGLLHLVIPEVNLQSVKNRANFL